MLNYLWTDIKIIFRIPLSIFFSIIYPLMMMFIIMLSYGNVVIEGNYHLIDKYFLITIGMGILPLVLVSFPIWIATNIENNSLKRMQYFRVGFGTIMISDIIAHFVVALFSLAVNIIVALVVFKLKIPPFLYFVSFIGQYMLAIIVFMLLGGLIALIFKKTQVVMSCGLVIMFALYMLCGAFISYEELPKGIQNIASYIPIKYAMNDFFDIWNTSQYFNSRFLILSIVYICIFLIGILFTYKKSFKR